MEKLKRYVIFIMGIFICSLGVSVITLTDLGASPISAIPYVLSLSFPMSIGVFTIIFSLLLVIIQIIMLRRDFKAESLLQIPVSMAFGYFIDLTMIFVALIPMETYPIKIMYLVIGCFFLGLGVYFEVIADVAMLPGESFVKAMTKVFKLEFGIAKISFDTSLAVIAAILSVILLGQLTGIREGTLVSAIVVGFIARILRKKLVFLERFLLPTNFEKESEEKTSENKYTHNVVIIDRQFGSGGREIGKRLAEKLNYKFYDSEIIEMISKQVGYSFDYVEEIEEGKGSSIIPTLENQLYGYDMEDLSPVGKIFKNESQLIEKLANKENCVIIGRCADYAIKNKPNCITLFLHANIEYRISKVMELENITYKEAENKIRKTDAKRSSYYHYYTDKKWGDSSNYSMSLDIELFNKEIDNILYEIVVKHFEKR